VDAGVSQRELASRYGCAPSLIARHVARGAGRGESPEQEGFGVPWPPGATSAAIFYYSGAFPTDLDPERAFIVHRGQVGNPERPSLVVFPLPPDARPAAEEPELNPDP